jgi:hypothetical protein
MTLALILAGGSLAFGQTAVAVEVRVLELSRTEADRVLMSPAGVFVSKKLAAEPARYLMESPHSKVVHQVELQVASGQTTHFRVDSRVPSATGNRGDGASYFDIGIGMDVLPKVFQNREISLKVSSRVRVLRNPEADGSPLTVFENPSFGGETRIGNGESMLIAGFITEQERAMLPLIPSLPDNPLLNYLFPVKRDSKERPEIVMVLTPRIVGPLVNAEVDVPPPVSAVPPSPPVAMAPKSGPAYTVQVGAFESSAKADSLVAQLTKKYDTAFVDKVSGKTPFRVRVGRLSSMSEARELQKKLAREGYDTFITKLD